MRTGTVLIPGGNLGIEAGFEGQRLPLDDARIGNEQAMYRFSPNIFAGARGTYRVLIGDEFADLTSSGDNPEGNLLNFGVMLGGCF